MEYRMEHDTMGEVAVPRNTTGAPRPSAAGKTSKLACSSQPKEIITAFAYLKDACAQVNAAEGRITPEQAQAVSAVCGEIREGKWDNEFPLVVWQTGSGTQTNMNVNEVIAHLAGEHGVVLHPNDHVNRSQSSNDTFPSALHIAACWLWCRMCCPPPTGWKPPLPRWRQNTRI